MARSRATNKPYPPYASLYLRGRDLDPEKVTKLLGMEPDKRFRRGEKRTASATWPHGLWMIESAGRAKSLELEAHIRWLLKRIRPVRAKLIRLLSDEAIDAEISCFWIMPASHEGLILEAKLLKDIAGLGVPLELDIYSPRD